jgi:hypothetical protein
MQEERAVGDERYKEDRHVSCARGLKRWQKLKRCRLCLAGRCEASQEKLSD